MNKLLLGATCTICVTTSTVSTFLTSSSSSTVIPDQVDTTHQKPIPTQKKQLSEPDWKGGIPKLNVATDIKNKGKYSEADCLKDYFKNINWSTSSSENWNYTTEKTNFSSSTKSCLVVEYYKQSYTNDKWWTEFRLIWSLKDETGKQGLITVLNAKTKNGKFLGSSVAYILKKDDKKNWNVSHKKETVEKAISDAEALKQFIPQPGTIKVNEKSPGENWGFNPEFENMCNDDCESPKNGHNIFSNTWDLKTGVSGATNVKDWCINLNEWFGKNFGWNSIESAMTNITGNWTKP